MSYAARTNRTESKDVVALRKEYSGVVRQIQETSDKASAAALRDKKNKAFEKVKEQINGERAESTSALHKVLIQQGRLKPQEQYARELAAAKAAAKR